MPSIRDINTFGIGLGIFGWFRSPAVMAVAAWIWTRADCSRQCEATLFSLAGLEFDMKGEAGLEDFSLLMLSIGGNPFI
jgi:hypothetical protein